MHQLVLFTLCISPRDQTMRVRCIRDSLTLMLKFDTDFESSLVQVGLGSFKARAIFLGKMLHDIDTFRRENSGRIQVERMPFDCKRTEALDRSLEASTTVDAA